MRPNQALQHNDPSCHAPCVRTCRASRGRGCPGTFGKKFYMRYINLQLGIISVALSLGVFGCSSFKKPDPPENTFVWILDADVETNRKAALLRGMTLGEVEDKLGHPVTIEKSMEATVEHQKWAYRRKIAGLVGTTYLPVSGETRQQLRFVDEIEIDFVDGKLELVKVSRQRDVLTQWDLHNR